MKKMISLGVFLMTFSLVSCSSEAGSNNVEKGKNITKSTAVSADLINYGSTDWVKKLHALKSHKSGKFRIVQLGDSHTAGDYFSDTVRQRLQSVFGNGGIGLVPPGSVSGQRTATVKHQNGSWSVSTSRKSSGDFPLGGVIARSSGGSAGMIIPNVSAFGEQNVKFTFKAPMGSNLQVTGGGKSQSVTSKSNQWQTMSVKSTLPLTYQALSGNWSLGQVSIENNQAGVVYSAMGINGARLSQNQKWRSDWADDLRQTEADLVILAYGTNEAADSNLDIAETEQYWRDTIHQIHKALPKAGILIIGAPESLKNTNGMCGTRLVALDSMQNLQQKVAKTQKTAYWSWQAAMGGYCSMKPWIAKGWGRPDGVHFSAEGYNAAASKLANAIIQIAN